MNYFNTKRFFFIPFFTLLLGGIFIQSCDQPSAISFSENEYQSVAGVVSHSINTDLLPSLKTNNTLTFNSFEQFGQFMNEFGEVKDIEPEVWVEQTLGFTSSLQRSQNRETWALEAIEEQNTEKPIWKELVPDPWFASVLNEEGLIEVENTVFQISDHYTVIYKDWETYHSFSAILDLSQDRLVSQRNMIESSGLEKINDSIYLFKIQGDEEEIYNPGDGDGNGSGSGGGNNGENGSCCPSERTEKYRSGGKDGRLLGRSWDVNYYLYSSFGTKSKHQRKGPLGIGWIARTADQLWLEADVSYAYPQTTIKTTSLSATLRADLSGVATWLIDQLVIDVLNLPVGNMLTRTLVDATSNVPLYKMEFKKETPTDVNVDGELITFPPVMMTAPSGNIPKVNTIKRVVDRATAIVGWPEILQGGATKFNVQYIEGYHKLKHDGHIREFRTSKYK